MVNQSVFVYDELDPNVKNTHVRNVFIDVLLKRGLVDDALKVLDEMLEKESIYPPNESTVDIFFHGWFRETACDRRGDYTVGFEIWRPWLLPKLCLVDSVYHFSVQKGSN